MGPPKYCLELVDTVLQPVTANRPVSAASEIMHWIVLFILDCGFVPFRADDVAHSYYLLSVKPPGDYQLYTHFRKMKVTLSRIMGAELLPPRSAGCRPVLILCSP